MGGLNLRPFAHESSALTTRPVVPNLFEVGEHLQIKNKSWEHYDGQTNIWEHLLLSSWEQFEENLSHLGILGSTWWKFWEHFWSPEHWLGNTALDHGYSPNKLLCTIDNFGKLHKSCAVLHAQKYHHLNLFWVS